MFRLDEANYEQLVGTVDDLTNYYKSVDSGFKKMATRSCVVCGIARDCESALRHTMIPQVERLISYFDDYYLCIIENDSKISSGDTTPEILKEWGQKHEKKSHIVCETNNEIRLGGWGAKSDRGAKRMGVLSKYRNKVLSHVHKYCRNFDYMIVLDWDLENGFSINGIAHTIDTFDKIDNWGAVTSMGVRGRRGFTRRRRARLKKYWDTWAYRDENNYCEFNEKVHKNALKHENNYIGSNIIKIGSGFNGLGVYSLKRLHKIMEKEGTDLYGDGKNCEHINLHHKLSEHGYSVWLNPSLVVYYGISTFGL